jgi:hypothetical protein
MAGRTADAITLEEAVLADRERLRDGEDAEALKSARSSRGLGSARESLGTACIIAACGRPPVVQ